VAGLISPTSDLAEVLCAPGRRFCVHVLNASHQRIAQHFSGALPAAPTGITTTATPRGPVLDEVADRALCHVTSTKVFGWSVLVEADVDEVQVGPAARGLAWYHGAYAALSGPG